MLKLTAEQYDEAVAVMAHELADAERLMVRTHASRALWMLDALGEHFDVMPKPNVTRPLANDDTDALIADYWADVDPEDASANALRKWTQGLIP